MAGRSLLFLLVNPLRRLTLVILSGVLVLGVSRADAGTLTTWHWAGPVTGYVFGFGSCFGEVDCGPRLETVVPLGTRVDVFVTLDPAATPNANCLMGTASATFQVLGRTYTGTGYVWEDGMGFGGGFCSPSQNAVEVVAPGWGIGGPALPDGWVPFPVLSMPGLWWSGNLADGQPMSIGSQFPYFHQDMRARAQRFTADLQAVPADMHPVPEPATMLLFGAGLATLAARRYRRRDLGGG